MARNVGDENAIRGFGTHRAAEIVGISYRQIDYWARTELLRPSLARASGSGSRRQYSYGDVLELKVIKRLLDAGVSLKKIGSIFDYIRRDLAEEVASARLVIDGSNVVFVRSDAELIDLLQSGQGVLNVLPLLSVKQEVDAAIINLFPAAEIEETDDSEGADEAPDDDEQTAVGET